MPNIVTIATLTPLPGKVEELVAAMSDLVEKVHANEDGCLLYALHRHPDGERLVMVEKYTGADAVEAHRSSEHFRAAAPVLRALLAAPPELLSLEPIPVGDPAKGAV